MRTRARRFVCERDASTANPHSGARRTVPTCRDLVFMNETLFSQIQKLFERTYTQVGINLEECLIDRRRCGQLSIVAGRSARELSELTRTFLRTADDRLYVGTYYSHWVT